MCPMPLSCRRWDKAAMEAELDSSAMGQSFEKTREVISEDQMEQLRTKGPLDQNEQTGEVWLGGLSKCSRVCQQ